jgi:hydrogenase maturation protease
MITVIGVGNPERGDDGAGREVARRLGALGFKGARIVEADGEATALLALMEKASSVFLIDACVSGAPAGSVRRVDLAQSPLPDARYGVSSHGFGLAEAIALGVALGALPPHCVLYAIEGQGFEVGAPLSTAVSAAVGQVVEALSREIQALQ